MELDGLFWASFHAKATTPASIGIKDKRLFASMDKKFEATDDRKFGFLHGRDGTNNEYIVRANRNARTRCFAAHWIDDRHHISGIKPAVLVKLHELNPPVRTIWATAHSSNLSRSAVVITSEETEYCGFN